MTSLTGVPPSVHGVSGNEFFIREQRRFAAPAPVGFEDSAPVLATYTDDYVNDLVHVPTVYERMRERDPDVLVWVAMHQLFRGADRLLVARRTVMFDAFEAYAQAELTQVGGEKTSRKVYEALDDEVVGDVASALEEGPVPDVLTVYISSHGAAHGVDAVQPEQAPEARMADDLRSVVAAEAVKDPIRDDHAGEPHEHDVAQVHQTRCCERARRDPTEILGNRQPDTAPDEHGEEHDDAGMPGHAKSGSWP